MNPRIDSDRSAQMVREEIPADNLAYRDMTADDVREVLQLLTATTRKTHQCISKGQLRQLAEQLMAQNAMLTKRCAELLAGAAQERVAARHLLWVWEAYGNLEHRSMQAGEDAAEWLEKRGWATDTGYGIQITPAGRALMAEATT